MASSGRTRYDVGMSRDIRKVADWVIKTIEEMGIPVKNGSRLRKMRSDLEQHTGFIASSTDAYWTCLQASLDFQIWEFILKQIGATVGLEGSNDPWGKALKNALKDAALPTEGSGNTRGRDTEFELYVAAICMNAGFEDVQLAEPDVTCIHNGTKYGIAAKRVKSVNQLTKRFGKAASQIEGTGLPGIIVVEDSLAFNPENAALPMQSRDAEYAKLLLEAHCVYLTQFKSLFRQRMKPVSVLGAVFHYSNLCVAPNGALSVVGNTLWFHSTELGESTPHIPSFGKRYISGIPNNVLVGMD